MTSAFTRAIVVSIVSVAWPYAAASARKTSAGKATDMVGKWQFLVDDDAVASNKMKQMNLWTGRITTNIDLASKQI